INLHSERRFPNEIFILIVENLRLDPPSLRNAALVCKDFAILSQQQIFRIVDLSPYDSPNSWSKTSLATRFARRLVRAVRLDVIDPNEIDDISFIFQSLPSVTELHFQAIGTHMGENLEALWIELWDEQDWQSFRDMLASLTVLKLLALPSKCFEDEPLILPSPLRTLYFRGNFSAVEQGLGISYPPMLSTVFLGFETRYDAPERRLLRVLRSDTRIVLDVGNGWYGENLTPVMTAFTQGLRVSKLTLNGFGGTFIIAFIAHFVSHLPQSVCEISIDFDAGRLGAVDLVSLREDWAQLDGALTQRYQLGLLKSFGVRCTGRTHRSDVWSFHRGSSIDRTILDHVRTLLPLSDAAGILMVDHAALYFDDYYF
ncbi:hypothetical protein BT96DRAFT_922748, partial [Gymnopus androsaceus JB14]